MTRPHFPTMDLPRIQGRARPLVDSLVDRSPQWRALADLLDGALAPPPGEGRAALGDIAEHALAAVVRDYRRSLDGTVERIDSHLGAILGDVEGLRRARGRTPRPAEAVAADMAALTAALQDIRTLRQHLTEALADTGGGLAAQLRHDIADALGVAVAQGTPHHLAGAPTPRPSARRPRELAASVTQRGGVIMSGQTAGTGGIRTIHGQRHADGSVGYVTEGEILDSIPREQAPNYQSRVASARSVGLPGYERAHLWGPGFGDEAADAIMYAPRGVNQYLQNLGIEGVIRQTAREARALGGRLIVQARAVSHPPGTRGLPPDFGGEALARVEYHVTVEFPDGRRQPQYTVGIDVDPYGRFSVDAPSHGHLDAESPTRRFVPDAALPRRPAATPAHPVFLNEVDIDAAELARLPGVGPVLGERIVAFIRARRATHGRNRPLSAVEDLLAVDGVGAGTIAAIRDLVDLSPATGGTR